MYTNNRFFHESSVMGHAGSCDKDYTKMREEEILRQLEELAEKRAAMERDFPAHWHRWQWSDDPEYDRVCLAMLNLKAKLGKPFGGHGRKGGRK